LYIALRVNPYLQVTQNMIRIACIIMAHKEPQQIERYIKKFSGFPFDFYIHLDKKIDLKPFNYLAGIPNVQFIKHRTKVRWASSSFIKAELQSFKEILATGIKYDYVSIMSGQDYPIKPISDIYDLLVKNSGKNFICFEEDGEWWKHAITRINKYHFTNFGFKGRYRIQFFINGLLPARKFPLPYKLYGGPRAMCMTLTQDCVVYLIQAIETNKKLQRFIHFTWGPDEFVFPTLIMNSHFRGTVINNNFYYIDWSAGGVNPKTLEYSDYSALVSSDQMFARKFDIKKDVKVLDMLDQRVDAR
jgi:Core-2/I-Branching enzyme